VPASNEVSGLVSHGDGPTARCALCGGAAVGPCARCRAAVCADCCELTTGGATTFAVCLRCIRRGGATLRPAWRGLLGWLAAIVLVLAGVGAILALVRHGGP